MLTIRIPTHVTAVDRTSHCPNIFGVFWIALFGDVTTNSTQSVHLVAVGEDIWALNRQAPGVLTPPGGAPEPNPVKPVGDSA
jgi:hypothetical protein